MRLLALLLAAILAAAVAYAIKAQAKPSVQITSVWLINVDEDPLMGTVTLKRSDFDEIVGAYNAQYAELARAALRGCR